MGGPCFPRLYAAASLKPVKLQAVLRAKASFPRLYAAASLKRRLVAAPHGRRIGFPRLYAAASLKRTVAMPIPDRRPEGFSAALCRGLIEAAYSGAVWVRPGRFSAALCRGLIEAHAVYSVTWCVPCVFRGFMPRPH